MKIPPHMWMFGGLVSLFVAGGLIFDAYDRPNQSLPADVQIVSAGYGMRVYHDKMRHVTCWVPDRAGIYCILDVALEDAEETAKDVARWKASKDAGP
jgi:hypothetical protein